MTKNVLFSITLSLFLVSCANNPIVIGKKLDAHASMAEKMHVASGVADFQITEINDLRENPGMQVGLAKGGVASAIVPIVFSDSFYETLKFSLSEHFLSKGFLISEESKNLLKIDVKSLKLWESPPRYIPERSYCEIISTVTLYSVKDQRDLWRGEINISVESPESFDATGGMSLTYNTCVEQFVVKVGKDLKLQKILNYTFQ